MTEQARLPGFEDKPPVMGKKRGRPEGILWNPWHGCRKISEGCGNCYVYRIDARRGLDASEIRKTASFDLPVRMGKGGEYKIPSGSMVWTCFSSDFFLDDADIWRREAWNMMRRRSDLDFFFITKRIHRIFDCLPPDWDGGWNNVGICVTMENQRRADARLPLLVNAPIKSKSIACEPLLGPVDISAGLGSQIRQVVAGGESGPEARICKYEWVLSLRRQCEAAGVPFKFKQTGTRFEKDGRVYSVPRKLQHIQARRAGIDFRPAGCRPII